ncbi:MAG: ABC transporter permease [bacterium]|nr:ABC transporter permease [bacterium]
MIRFILKRLLHAIPLLIGITIISFFIIQLAPGDYFTQMELNPEISKETLEKLRTDFGYDKPIWIQYLRWLKNLSRFDFGVSISYHIPVATLIKQRVLATLYLSLVVIFFLWLISIPLGLFCATHQKSFQDKVIMVSGYIGMSMPSFFFAFLLIFFSAKTDLLPIGGIVSINFDDLPFFSKVKDLILHITIPASVIIFGGFGYLTRIMKGYLLDVLSSPYIIAARARGLSEFRVIGKHGLANALNPMITIFGFQLSGILGGAALIEIITRWPGMGRLMLDAVLSQDLYLVMAGLVISSLMLIGGNLIADILLALSDPRIRYK